MSMMDKLTPTDIQTILHQLGIEYKKGRFDKKGYRTIKSPLRDEKKPSFGINPDTGGWKDHGTGETGDLVTLVERFKKIDNKEAIGWIKEQIDLTGALYDTPKNGKDNSKKTEPENFWTPERNIELKEAQQRRENEPEHEVIKQANDYDCLEIETLQAFGVGLVEKWGKDWLGFPYDTGCQLYRRENTEKVIRSLKGSSPGASFFGSRIVEKDETDKRILFIAKSPRENMLLWQKFNTWADVIGLATGEQGSLSPERSWLSGQISKSNYKGIWVFLDCNTETAYQTAKALASTIKALALKTKFTGEVSLINIHQYSEGRYKDFTDCIRDGMDEQTIKDLFKHRETIKIHKPKTETNANGATSVRSNTLDEQLDISTAPAIPDEVYRNLPDILKTRCSLLPEPYQKDVFLVSALPAISSQMPNVLAEHKDKYYSPDIFTQIVAGPAMGKGEATKGRGLASITDNEIRQEAEREIQDYERKPDEEKATTTKPKKRSLFIPANASSRKMLDRLEANGGSGFIFENEIDTLINATKQDWGNYTDTMRKAFQHEALSIIRTDGEYYIERPRLSICLTGTFDQFKAMFESAENGHFSRYALYTFQAPREWQSHRPTKKSRGLRESVETGSQDLYEMYQRLKKRETPLYIDLTPEQWDAIDNTFSEKMQLIEDLGLSPYLHASNNRTAIIALRLVSIFTVLRANDEDPNRLIMEKRLTPTRADMIAALWLADTFIKHAIRLYYLLPKAGDTDSKGERYKKFISSLPKKFETSDALKIAEELEIPESTTKYWLSNMDEFNRTKRGWYEKV